MASNSNRPGRILILGSGFGGLYTALHLEKKLRRYTDVELTLVNRENFFLFTPMLHEVAAGDLDLTHIVNPVRKLLRRTHFFNGDIKRIDLKERRVIVAHADDHHDHELSYDYLVLALGSVTNFYNLPGLAENALTMKSLSDAIRLRSRLIKNLEDADFECACEDRSRLLTVVVAGGGFAGVETIASVNDFVREAIEFYPKLTEAELRIVLIEATDVILPELGPQLGAYARKKLARRGVQFLMNTAVKSVSNTEVNLSDGTSLKTNMLVWTAGVSPNPLLNMLDCSKERGRLVTNEFLEVTDYPGVWALGDCAAVPDQTTGKSCPPTAQHAIRQGKVVAENLVAAINGGRRRRFEFKTIGALASIGKRTGVARIMGVNFSGFIAWWLWRTIYLSKLPRFEKKVRVALDWFLDLLFSKDLVQFMDVSMRVERPALIEAAADDSESRAA
ncbi:MAG TPA: NAD(P)/FAD-dependent oxidoreductase [Pyrinomonadaceae bacterium]|jgi:NADH dehydrogenase|nr:NAD(P)/FAD-dependent oxidoreductase [Pyrinomonadaceae bacterium]